MWFRSDWIRWDCPSSWVAPIHFSIRWKLQTAFPLWTVQGHSIVWSGSVELPVPHPNSIIQKGIFQNIRVELIDLKAYILFALILIDIIHHSNEQWRDERQGALLRSCVFIYQTFRFILCSVLCAQPSLSTFVFGGYQKNRKRSCRCLSLCTCCSPIDPLIHFDRALACARRTSGNCRANGTK